MNAANRIKNALSWVARRLGYKIERLYDPREHKLDVFQLMVERLDPGRPTFFFLQVGANDGRTGDPIHDMVTRYHWKGILVEPLPDAFARLASNYRGESQLILENAAIAHEDGVVSLWTRAESDGVLATFDRSALRARSPRSAKLTEVPVRAISLNTLLLAHRVGHIDLLQIDTEGFDFEILKMLFGHSSIRPSLIRYEHLHLSPSDRRACVDLLAAQGYRMFIEGIDTIALLLPSGPGHDPATDHGPSHV